MYHPFYHIHSNELYTEACPESTDERPEKPVFVPFFFLEPSVKVIGSPVETGGNIEDYLRFLSCHLFGPVNHGQIGREVVKKT